MSRWGGDLCGWVCENVSCIIECLNLFQSSVQSSIPGPSVTSSPNYIPHYNQGKVILLLFSAH